MTRVQDKLKDYINYGVGLTVSVGVGLLTRDQLLTLIRDNVVVGALALTLLAVTVIRFLAYIHAVRNEVDLMETAFDTARVTNLKGPVFPIMVFLSLSFAVLIASVTDILIYCAAAVVFSAADLTGAATVQGNIARVLLDDRFRREVSGSPAHVLYKYYFERPILLRSVVSLLAVVAALLLVVLSRLTGNMAALVAAYGVAISTGIVAELVILRWRMQRDREWEQLCHKKTCRVSRQRESGPSLTHHRKEAIHLVKGKRGLALKANCDIAITLFRNGSSAA